MSTALLEKELDENYKKVKKGECLGRPRRFFAYSLKIIAGGAGLIIATGKLTSINQELGIAVLVAIFIDSVFSNHLRLLAETQAAHAYAALGRRVKSKYNGKRGSIIRRITKGDAEAEQELEQLMLEAHEELSTSIDIIENKLAEADIIALKSLSLDDERNAKKPPLDS